MAGGQARRAGSPVALLLALAMLAGCATAAPVPAHSPRGETWSRSELLFGLSREAGPAISDEEWNAFVREEIAPRFPAGFTILVAAGHWRDASGSHDEPARLLLVVHRVQDGLDLDLEEIRSAYKSRFDQQAVLRLDSPVRARF